MADTNVATDETFILRTADGAWYKLPASQLESHRMSEDEIAQIRELAPEDADTAGFQAGSNTGSSYTWLGMYYLAIGVDPSFVKYAR